MDKPRFTKQYQALINTAAGIARKEGGVMIERRHLLIALNMVAPQLLKRLLGCRQLYFVEKIPSGISDIDVTNEITFSRESYKVLSLFGGILGKIIDSTGSAVADIEHVAAALLVDDSPDNFVRELLNANGLSVNKAAVLEALRRMGRKNEKRRQDRQVYQAVATIRKRMQERVIGQNEAISKICNTLLWHWLLPTEERKTPLTLSILGKSGSGKTLMAMSLAQAIAQARDSSITVLNGGVFASENTSHDVIGYDASWKGGARIGSLTGPVMNDAKAVLVLENFDLLHPIARSHIMTALTTGYLKDDMAGREISFRQTTVVLLTSAGCESMNCNEGTTGKARARIVEELTNNIDDPNRRDNVVAFTGSASEVVMLKDLSIPELRQIFVRTIDDEIASLEKTICKGLVVEKDRLAEVLIEAISSLNPCEALSLVRSCIGDPLRKEIMESKGSNVNSVIIKAEPGGTTNLDAVASNLVMRRRRVVSTDSSLNKSTLTLTVKTGDYVLLPAIRDGIIKIEPPKAGDTFDQLVGLDSAIEYSRRWINYFEKKSAIRPDGMILSGPPGTGKTSFVRCLAAEIKRPYAILNCSDLSSAEAITSAFQAFRRYGKDGLVVFLDELDAVAGDRDNEKNPAYIERLNLLLENIDGFHNDPACKILYIGATNRVGSLDPAIMRDGRLGRVIKFGELTDESRRKLLVRESRECNFTSIPRKLLDFMVKTTANMSGSMLKAIVRELAMSVGDVHALTRERYLNARRTIINGECTTTVQVKDAQLLWDVAVHEAGHAIVVDALGREFVQCQIVQAGDRLGFVESLDTCCTTEVSLVENIDIALAGRAAQEVIGLPLSGAGSDLKTATRWALEFIQNGYSDECGLLYREKVDEQMKEVARKILDERYAKVRDRLAGSKELLKDFAKMLERKKILFQDDLRKLKASSAKKKGTRHGCEK